jgi:hypothetical protein
MRVIECEMDGIVKQGRGYSSGETRYEIKAAVAPAVEIQ